MKLSKCRSCGASILWAKTATGKNMPVDLDSMERRAVIIHGVAEVHETYLSHFATCPQADQWRKK